MDRSAASGTAGRILLAGAVVLVAGIAALGLLAAGRSIAIAFTLHGLATAGAFAWLVRAAVAERARLADVAERLGGIAAGRRTTPRDTARRTDAPDDPIEAALAKVARRVARTRKQFTSLSARLEQLPTQVAAAMKGVERSAEEQEGAVEETASLLANINKQVRDIAAEVENLARSNEETAASIQQMGTAVEQVASSSVSLQETVESSTASIHEMGANIQRVAQSSDEVQQVAQETAAAVTQMDRAIQEVGHHVLGASELTKKVSESAEEGTTAVMATIQGIAAIRDQTQGAKTALEGLAERIGQVGEIATVIGGVSDETNLLSLNAAIIAAQAGEHGKAFAVVADQVKTLAQRTSTKAKEIEEMIRGVQAEWANTARAMAAGIESVEEGVARSRVAGETLGNIQTTADEASRQVQEIARATEEQARNSKHVADAAHRVSQHVQQISRAMSEQSEASENLLRNADLSLDMCRQMSRALEEQRATGRYITGNSESITEMIRKVQASTESHFHASAGVASRFSNLLENAQGSCARIPEVTRVVSELVRAAEAARSSFETTSEQSED